MTQWDGLTSSNSLGESQRICVLGATNRIQDIDEAILRRLPKKFPVSLPSASQRRSIFSLTLKNTRLSPHFDFGVLVKISAGMSGSDIKEACRDAAMVPVREYIREAKARGANMKGVKAQDVRGLHTDDFFGRKGGALQMRREPEVDEAWEDTKASPETMSESDDDPKTHISSAQAKTRSTMADCHYQDVHIGAAWISMIEPSPGHERSFNRWYANDHFYSGGMCLPGIFAGRRWVATKALRQLRYANTEDMRDYGCYLHTNLFAAHLVDEVNTALSKTLQELGGEGRMYEYEIPRRHIYTAITPYQGVVYSYSAAEGPLDIHALDYPFKGVVLEIIDARSVETRPQLIGWLKETFVPLKINQSPAMTMCLIFTHADLPEMIKSPRLPVKLESGDQRIVLLWFLEKEPRECWTGFEGHAGLVDESDLGDVVLVAPFMPTVPGTDRYVDELR
ncbi:hypothetical protein D6D17_08186 [Aureobasidium pullulans]|nr:hypothetical protein D6D17_08186 [Aureobasidium pullulans]